MLEVYLLISLIILLLICFYSNKQDITSPSIAFLAPFCLASMNLLFNISKWKVDIQNNTFNVIIWGSVSLILGIFLTKIVIKALIKKSNLNYNESYEQYIEKCEVISIQQIKKLLFLAFQSVSFIICLIAVIKVSKGYGGSGGIGELIGNYKYMKSFTLNDMSTGSIPNLLYDFCYASGFIWLYIAINNYLATKKFDYLIILNLVLSIAISLTKGSRGGAVALIVSGIAMLIIFIKKNSKKQKIPLKHSILILTIVFAIVGTFQGVGELLGRKSSADFNGYLSVYLGAPIRNLDYFLNNTYHTKPDIFGKMTFVNAINYLGNKLDIAEWNYILDLPPLRANGFVTGNVYTAFYAYLYDFGFIGVPIIMLLIGIISEIFHFNALKRRTRKSKKLINIWVLIYSYIFYLLCFSFFSNKFFEGLMSIQFFKYVIFWFFIRWYLQKIKIKV